MKKRKAKTEKQKKIKKKAAPDKTGKTGKLKTGFIDLLFWIVGCSFYALAVDTFTAPNQIAPGGFTGLSTLINFLTGAPIGVTVLVLNIPLFLIAFKVFGWRFILKTLFATVMASVFIDVFALFVPPYTGDRLLAALFGGGFSGIGLGLVFLRGATTGGTDILGRLLKLKFRHISMGTLVMFMDMFVVACSGIVYKNIESILYATIVFFVSSKAIDYIIYGTGRGKMLMIVTKQPEKISPKVIEGLHRGVSLVPVKGGYTGQDQHMLICVVRPSEVAKLNKIVKENDPAAFIIISDVSEVLGQGFKNAGEDLI
ncbi:MAG: YitT family protein [Clostridiales bacterium]|nr:YitT family protein [Clostridiales bacterium]